MAGARPAAPGVLLEGRRSIEAALVETLLVIGGQRRGITRSFLGRTDLLVRIPYGRPGAASLGAAAGTGIAIEGPSQSDRRR